MFRLLIPLLLLAVAVGSFVLFTNPLWTEVKSLREEQAAFDEALDNSRQFQALRTELANKFNSFSPADKEKLNRLLPDSPDSIRLITQIDRIVTDHGFFISNIKFEIPETKTDARFAEPVKERGSRSFNIEFSIGGGRYSDFVSLMTDLESSLRLIDVESLTFSSQTTGKLGAGAPRDIYNYAFKVHAYWLSQS